MLANMRIDLVWHRMKHEIIEVIYLLQFHTKTGIAHLVLRRHAPPTLNCFPVPHSFQTLIECHVDVKTTDGYLLRVFCIGFTKRQPYQIKKTAYAKTSQSRAIRRRMVEVITREVSQIDLKEVVNKL